MGNRGKKPRNKRSGPQNPAARARRSTGADVLDDEPIPMTYQGRLITPEVIAQMRAAHPEDAHQLDTAWEQAVLDHNRPWLEDKHRAEQHDGP